MNNETDLVLQALLRYGLRMKRTALSAKEIHRQKVVIEDLLSENDAETLIDAIRYGMPNVWPYTEDNRTFSAVDLEKNLLKAKAEAGQTKRAGEIAYRPGRG